MVYFEKDEEGHEVNGEHGRASGAHEPKGARMKEIPRFAPFDKDSMNTTNCNGLRMVKMGGHYSTRLRQTSQQSCRTVALGQIAPSVRADAGQLAGQGHVYTSPQKRCQPPMLGADGFLLEMSGFGRCLRAR